MSGHPDLTEAPWRKSARSAEGADCVEVAPVIGVAESTDSTTPNVR
jgi:Domain of unknown function (DUF397)